jgi:stearoyl-CoA desaturase (Delta-9 desaturase)
MIADKATMESITLCKTKVASAKGPLGKWQPYYDTTYTILMQTFNMPHLAAISLFSIVVLSIRGDLKITPMMPLVAFFAMARVPFVGLGMSMCLHRYFAHGAYKTSRFVQFLIAIIGSLALQGGVLWWAGKHRRHHKHCDQPQDPHSPTQTSWVGWMYYETHHDWAFIPQHLQTPEVLIVNLLFVVPNFLLTWSLIPLVGKEWALFLCYVPACVGCLASLRFNVEYHPAPKKPAKLGECLSINKESGDKGIGPLRLDWLAKNAPFLFEPLVGEAYHDDHHDFPRRAQRPGLDVPYFFVLRPLSKLGVIWDLQQPLECN